MYYRPEIDGLRAIAVLSVIFFHANFDYFSGGYIGVDIFFVISGYLITSIIINDLNQDKFSIKSFYERRARRILPALFTTLILSLTLGILIMDPSDLYDLSKTSLSVLIFLSNILLYSQNGYFDATIENNPLFHTWSLSVEEQYYLIIPLLLVYIFRRKLNHLLKIFLILTISSLLLAELIIKYDAMFAFFQIPTRFWELGFGSIVAILESKKSFKFNKFQKNFATLIGLTLIFFSIHLFDENSSIPGLITLIPIAGTALLIYFSRGTYIAKILSLKPFVGIGLISYSAYLLHQPIFAFVRIYRFDNIHTGIYSQAILATLIGAFVIWRYIERPFRNRDIVKLKTFLIITFISVFSLILMSIFIMNKNGLENFYKSRLSEQEIIFFKNAKELANNRKIGYSPLPNNLCFNPKKENYSICKEKYGNPILIFGDSHAANLTKSISLTNSYKFLIFNEGHHCHLYHFYEENSISTCNFKQLKEELTLDNNYKAFIYNQLGSYFLITENGETLNHVSIDYLLNDGLLSVNKNRIEKNLEFLNSLSGEFPIIWLASWIEPRYPLHNPRKAAKYGLDKIAFHPEVINGFKKIDAYAIDYIKKNNLNVHYITLFDYKNNKNWIEIFEQDCVTFNDKDHLSDCGLKIASPFFEKKLDLHIVKP